MIETGALQLRSHHGTWLACDDHGFRLVDDENHPALTIALRIGAAGLALAHDPGVPGSLATVIPAFIAEVGPLRVSIELADGGLLTATPHLLIETGRPTVGTWEHFVLCPSTRPLPLVLRPVLSAAYLSTLDSDSMDWDALVSDCRAPARISLRDAGIDALLLAHLPAERLRRLLPELRNRADYGRLFPSIQSRLAAGQRRSEWHTRAHLGADLPPGWNVGDHSYGAPEIIDGQYGRLSIGRYCSIAGGVKIVVANHAINTLTTYPFTALRRFWPSAMADQADHGGDGVVIGNHVWIGTGACLLPGARIGDGAIVGAHSVVAGQVPAYAVVVGNPSRIIRRRFDDATIARLLACAWWDWPDHQVDRALPLLMGDDPELLFEFAAEQGLDSSAAPDAQAAAINSANSRACARAP